MPDAILGVSIQHYRISLHQYRLLMQKHHDWLVKMKAWMEGYERMLLAQEAGIGEEFDMSWVLEIGLGMLFEPLDWAFAARDLFLEGELSALIGLLPIIPASIRHFDAIRHTFPDAMRMNARWMREDFGGWARSLAGRGDEIDDSADFYRNYPLDRPKWVGTGNPHFDLVDDFRTEIMNPNSPYHSFRGDFGIKGNGSLKANIATYTTSDGRVVWAASGQSAKNEAFQELFTRMQADPNIKFIGSDDIVARYFGFDKLEIRHSMNIDDVRHWDSEPKLLQTVYEHGLGDGVVYTERFPCQFCGGYRTVNGVEIPIGYEGVIREYRRIFEERFGYDFSVLYNRWPK
jgi:hypothetical protein